MNRLPYTQGNIIVSVICEGPEEYDYLQRLSGLGVWSPKYRVDLTNAKGNGNIPARYQDRFQMGTSDIVLVFCDTDKKPYEQYTDIKRKIDEFHGVPGVSNSIVIFGNPCTLQIVSQHWDSVMLKSPSKHSNAAVIERYTGIKDYDAHETQRSEILKQITADNYHKMIERVSKLSKNDSCMNSSNFDILMRNLESEDTAWIDEIDHILDGTL